MQATLQGIKKACPRCGKLTDHEFLVGLECVKCDKLVGDDESRLSGVRNFGIR
jgi:uncharacterized protein (DUF983 family)